MWKKIICFIVIINLFIANMQCVLADDIEEDIDSISSNELLQVVNTEDNEPNLDSRIAVAYDRTSGNVIYGKNENKRTAMASTTNVMET